MSDINKAVDNWFQTSNGKKRLKALGISVGNKSDAAHYASVLRGYLRETTSNLISNYGNAFIDYLDIRVYQDSGKWCADIYFDEDMVMQDSLYPAKYAPRYLPAIVNNSWSGDVNARMGGYNRHGDYVHATNDYKNGSFKHFIQKAVQRLKNEAGANIQVKISHIFN